MKTQSYPVIGNCNYESDDRILLAVSAVKAGLTDDEELIRSLDNLEATLTEHSDSGHVNSVNACRDAEWATREAYERVEREVDSARQARYID